MESIAHDLVMVVIGAAVASAAPWPLKALWQALRGDADRARQAADAKAERDERATAAALQAALGEVGRQVARVGVLEELVDLLRKALDKHLIRESAIASACELLIALAGLMPTPSGAMLQMRDRAQQLLEDALAHAIRIDESQ